MNNRIFIPFKDKNLSLAVGITSLIVAIVYFTSPVDISNKLAPGWALVTMIWFYKYWSFSKYGNIIITETTIQKNAANIRGLQKIDISDIETVISSDKKVIFHTKNRKMLEVYLRCVPKEDLDKFKEFVESLSNDLKTE